MTANEIMTAIDKGKKVYWYDKDTEVKKNKLDQYIIYSNLNKCRMSMLDTHSPENFPHFYIQEKPRFYKIIKALENQRDSLKISRNFGNPNIEERETITDSINKIDEVIKTLESI